jgi:uncharacterized membrane protein (DUF485 family)
MWYRLSETVLVSGSIPVSFEFRETWPSPLSTAVTWLAMAAVNAAGVLLCYEANRQGDNREFVNRLVCLSWPITIRVTVLFVVPVLVTVFAAAWWCSWPGSECRWSVNPEAELVPLLFGFVVPTLYYARLRSHLRWVAAVPLP